MNKYRNLFIWVLMAVMTILLINLLNTPKKAEEEMIFSEFIAKLDAGNVEEVVIKENYVMGRLNDGKKFKTYLAEYPDLVKELKAKGVKITAKPPEQNPWYVNFFFSWGPIIFLVLVWIFFMRQMQSGGNKALSFGKSKAKLVSDKAVKITFADVAGIEEAKRRGSGDNRFSQVAPEICKTRRKNPQGCIADWRAWNRKDPSGKGNCWRSRASRFFRYQALILSRCLSASGRRV